MKCHSSIAYMLLGCLLLAATALAAQDSPAAASSSGASGPGAGGNTPLPPPNTASMRTPNGEVTVNSAPAAQPAVGVAPPFATLSGGAKMITPAQAEAYPPLANDFIHADTNRDGTVDAGEYAHWTKQL